MNDNLSFLTPEVAIKFVAAAKDANGEPVPGLTPDGPKFVTIHNDPIRPEISFHVLGLDAQVFASPDRSQVVIAFRGGNVLGDPTDAITVLSPSLNSPKFRAGLAYFARVREAFPDAQINVTGFSTGAIENKWGQS